MMLPAKYPPIRSSPGGTQVPVPSTQPTDTTPFVSMSAAVSTSSVCFANATGVPGTATAPPTVTGGPDWSVPTTAATENTPFLSMNAAVSTSSVCFANAMPVFSPGFATGPPTVTGGPHWSVPTTAATENTPFLSMNAAVSTSSVCFANATGVPGTATGPPTGTGRLHRPS